MPSGSGTLVVSVATPEALRVAVPRSVPVVESVKSTVPGAGVEPTRTVAVKVSAWPKSIVEAESEAVVAVWPPTMVSAKGLAALELAWKLAVGV